MTLELVHGCRTVLYEHEYELPFARAVTEQRAMDDVVALIDELDRRMLGRPRSTWTHVPAQTPDLSDPTRPTTPAMWIYELTARSLPTDPISLC